ncbi:MAG: sugar transferase [Tannerellaceae bacterium]|jgi:lipopolysaccharide/colanic/teichoic acid biosynthesis glycosyltransferase|nr:sugar transferase [Tannerellaceae bacterium]
MKRLFDVIFSLLALSVFAIPMCVIAFLLRCVERHPVFFRQERIGQNKKAFSILKFQTLVNDVPTPVGRHLRRTGVDEWAQFFNVLKGDMSIVGPRALTPADVERLGWNDEFHAVRWNVKPGISGPAQLYGGQHRKTSWFWDTYYIVHQNLKLDFCIVVASFAVNIFGKLRVRKIIFKNRRLK